jgi:hypothetical protein
MATRKMTFSLPEDLAERFVRRIGARDRSRFLAKSLERSLREEERDLVESCLRANEDVDAATIEREWEATQDDAGGAL